VLQNSTNPTAVQPAAGDVVFCRDFLIDGGLGQGGSCCSKDDEWSAWCSKVGEHMLILVISIAAGRSSVLGLLGGYRIVSGLMLRSDVGLYCGMAVCGTGLVCDVGTPPRLKYS
jgi:hypothetical protein